MMGIVTLTRDMVSGTANNLDVNELQAVQTISGYDAVNSDFDIEDSAQAILSAGDPVLLDSCRFNYSYRWSY